MYSEEHFDENNQTDNVLRVAIGSDHGGYEAKELLKKHLMVLN